MTPDNKNFEQIQDEIDLRRSHRFYQIGTGTLTAISAGITTLAVEAAQLPNPATESISRLGIGGVIGMVIGGVGTIYFQNRINLINRKINQLEESSKSPHNK